MWVEAEKEGYPGDPFKGTDQGKSSHVSSAGNRVISHETVDRNDTAVKAPHTHIQDNRVEINQ
jgi:hypothetical protein